MIESVCGICLDTRVTMIIVDELHNLDMTTRAGAEASDTLKYFSERLPSTFVYSGIGLDRGALLAGPRGDQVAGRFTLIPTSAFTPGQEWAALIAALEGSLRLYRHKDGALVTLADYLHRRTRGMIGSLLWLIRDAACQAILDGTEKITRKSLDQIAVDMTAQAPPPRTGAREAVTNMLPRDRAEQILADHAAGKPVRAIAESLRPQRHHRPGLRERAPHPGRARRPGRRLRAVRRLLPAAAGRRPAPADARPARRAFPPGLRQRQVNALPRAGAPRHPDAPVSRTATRRA